ncbi:MAG TPA: M1 family peptidase, partial [Streptomyces sp.]
AMHALRREMGDPAFDRLLHEWPSRYRHGNATWADFEGMAGRISGKNLKEFFAAWFRGTTLPADADLFPGSLRS